MFFIDVTMKFLFNTVDTDVTAIFFFLMFFLMMF